MHIVYVGNDEDISLAGAEGLYKQMIIKQIGKVDWSQSIADIEISGQVFWTVSYKQQRELILFYFFFYFGSESPALFGDNSSGITMQNEEGRGQDQKD